MKRRTLLAATAAVAASPFVLAKPAISQTRTRIVWWHAMTATNAEQVGRIVQQFNAAQNEAEVQPIYKGTYPETLTAAIAAFRAGQAPHLVQVFEVGTGSMLAAGKGREADLAAVGGDRNSDRPSAVHPGGARLLQPLRRAPCLHAVQLINRHGLVQQGGVRESRA